MAERARQLLVGSMAPCSGKTATIVGLACQLQQRGMAIACGKPLGTTPQDGAAATEEADLQFIQRTLALPPERCYPPILQLDSPTVARQLRGEGPRDLEDRLQQYAAQFRGDLTLLEGPQTLAAGAAFQLSLPQMAAALTADVALVARYDACQLADELLAARSALGERLLGVAISDVPAEALPSATTELVPYLERSGIPVLGALPRQSLLRGVSVRELAQQLQAQVLCRRDRLDLMVETLAIGAMNVSSAIQYFRQRANLAVVTGGDRSDLQMAALETATTHCLVLTGGVRPRDFVLAQAERLEIPVLSVDRDTLAAVETADWAFGQARFAALAKVPCVRELIGTHFDTDRLLRSLGWEPAVPTP
ncbi:MAG: hypothetical protein BRC58_00580 [Cyanobacteria bacterium QS_8_64_29]|nr:MAG: hypothetical protein BRC58_00580 [Cyanobacteria bacterium QS_8_64_29]